MTHRKCIAPEIDNFRKKIYSKSYFLLENRITSGIDLFHNVNKIKEEKMVRNDKFSTVEKNLLFLKNVDPKNKKQTKKCLRELTSYSAKLTENLSANPLLYRTYKEPSKKTS